MAQHTRLEVYNTLAATGLVPVFYEADATTAQHIVAACVAGGVRVVEFTNRADFALDVFRELRQNLDVILGIGSVVDAPTAALFIANGADFVVSPSLNPEIARLCNRRKIAYMPGCGTLTEIGQAEELGVEIVKVFPGKTVGGAEFVKAVKAPCPWTSIMPTGGVSATQESITAWFKAGVTCVGMGSQLITKEDVATGNYTAITERTAHILEWIRTAKT